jgi:hypothetical protein
LQLKQEEFKFKARPAPKTMTNGGFAIQTRPESKGRARVSSTNNDHRKQPNVRKTQSETVRSTFILIIIFLNSFG